MEDKGIFSKENKEKLTKISKVVESWNIDPDPKYRRYKCGNCLKDINMAWHIWFSDNGYKCEVHLCRDCGKLFGLKK